MSILNSRWRGLFVSGLVLSCVCVGLLGCSADEKSNADSGNTASSVTLAGDTKSQTGTRLTRLFWQNRAARNLRAADLIKDGDAYRIEPLEVGQFPSLSPETHDLVQMAVAHGRLFVGVRDQADGKTLSGWVEISPGVEEESHGDHSHWHYQRAPEVCHSQLDQTQGNPAHVYRYGRCVYVANDKKNGFTQISSPKNDTSKSEAKFFVGGGGHITLAAVGDRVAYSSWIDRSGENAGRVDVVGLRGSGASKGYSFRLPRGGIHGATACGNRVFFAPAGGVCWVDCDFDMTKNADSVEVNELSLDETADGSEYRTGAFCSFQNHVLCIANSKTGTPALCVIDGTAPEPTCTRVQVDGLESGLRLSTVRATLASLDSGTRPFAFAFAEGDSGEEKLYVFELDPNGDRRFDDVRLVDTLSIGKSQLEGHFGHHGLTFLDDKKTAVLTNPGDGTLSILDLRKLEIVQTLDVSGQPTHVVSIGGRP